jgi:endonuclease/exonuclease/phosphatase family metal-dependent hydrolase
MNAGRGDLPRLLADLGAGRLTARPAADYLVLLQEAVEGGPHDVPALARTRGLSAFYVPVRYDGRRIRGNAIVSTRRLVNARRITLPEERQPRAAVAAAIDVAGQRLFVVSTHLENRVSWLKGGLLSDSARQRQADALLQSLPPSEPGIVGGYFNTWLGTSEPAWRAFVRRFTDTPPERPQPTFRDRLALDYLFFDLPTGWDAKQRVLPDKYGSDHHPVLGEISLNDSLTSD